MDSKIIKYVPAKFRNHVTDAYRDEDGIWVCFDDSVIDRCTESHTVHVETVSELKANVKTLKNV